MGRSRNTSCLELFPDAFVAHFAERCPRWNLLESESVELLERSLRVVTGTQPLMLLGRNEACFRGMGVDLADMLSDLFPQLRRGL